MDKKVNLGGARPGSGRKPILEGAVTVPVTVKLTPPQRDKLQRLGGAPWMRKAIDKAKEPAPKE